MILNQNTAETVVSNLDLAFATRHFELFQGLEVSELKNYSFSLTVPCLRALFLMQCSWFQSFDCLSVVNFVNLHFCYNRWEGKEKMFCVGIFGLIYGMEILGSFMRTFKLGLKLIC